MFRASVKRTVLLLALVILLTSNTGFNKWHKQTSTVKINIDLFDKLGLAKIGLNRDAFEKAFEGWQRLKSQINLKERNVISIADFSQSSCEKRLYIVDLDSNKVLYNTYVSHGRNSGLDYAKLFGNKHESYKSSLGFYLTGSSYNGSHGLSMRLEGLEPGINNHALERAIVVHGADYVSQSFIEKYGRLGRSQGCPAIPHELCEPIVNTIKDGSCFFIYYPDSSYLKRSAFLR